MNSPSFSSKRKRLFILGNGFDMAHDLKTGYPAYFAWLLKETDTSVTPRPDINHQQEAQLAINALSDFWGIDVHLKQFSGLEDKLAKPLATVELVGEDVFSRCFEAIHHTFSRWSYWCYQEDKGNLAPVYDFLPNDTFVTFNYTRTLEDVYEIEDERICHIHGDAEKATAFNELLGMDDETVAVVFGPNTLEFVSPALKNTICKIASKYLKLHNQELHSLMEGITEIHVVGSSISLADVPYFNLWLNPLNLAGGAKVFVHYSEEKETFQKKCADLRRLNFDTSLITIEGNDPLKLKGSPLKKGA